MRQFDVRLLRFNCSGRFWLMGACGLLFMPLTPKNVLAQSPVPVPPADVFAQDARMRQNVKVRASGLAVKDLLARLSQAAGVQLTADKLTAEDKVIAFSPARPLQATLADVAALFNDYWRRETTSDGKPRYLLTRNPRAIALEENLLNQSRHRLITQLEAQVRALAETPEQLAQRPANDPIRKNLSIAENRAATQVYAALAPEQRDVLFSRRYLNFAATAINPQMREPIGKVYEASMRFVARFRQPGDGSPKETVEDYARRGIQFAIHTSGGHVIPAVQVYGKGTMHAALFAELDARKQWILLARGNPYAQTSSPVITSLPDTEQTGKAQSEKLWVDRLRKLADLSGKPIIADFYRSQAVNMIPSDIKLFRVDAYVVDTTVPEGGFKDAELTMMWNVGDGGFASQSIRLPYRLPNDAQTETEITVETGRN